MSRRARERANARPWCLTQGCGEAALIGTQAHKNTL